MSVSSQFLNYVRDSFLPEDQSAKLQKSVKYLDTAKKVLIVASIGFICLAVYSHSPLLLIPAYISGESAMISSNVQEIYNDVRTTLSVVCSKSHCQKQLFKNAPFFRLINWVIDPYVHTEERARTLILDHISAGIKSMQNTPPESWKSTIPKLLEKSEKP